MVQMLMMLTYRERSPICLSELIFYYVDSPHARIMLKLCCSKPIAYVCMMLPCGKPITWAHWASFAPVIIDVLKYSLDLEDATV